ncbi:hypothetical protein OG948_05030 [Embleya sp. NBC_00888]|uniref:hypothetical protein n=1 Tax=Embleya sp. NBC_00888 TaxID=2975960 RepID=UPI003862ED0B|nr:hypothetical protein OG948_05030 [Embleya sp. NBC_00888]
MNDQGGAREVVCPVCWGVMPYAGPCASCDWPPPAPGPTAYQDAARAFDHAAAIRVAHARGYDGVPDDLAKLVRHGPVRSDTAFPAAEPLATSGRAAALTLLTALTAGELDLLLFLEIGTRHLSTQWVTIDEFGFVRVPARNWARLEWRGAVPWLPEDAAARDLTLAGGVGRSPAVGTAQTPEPLGPRARRELRETWAGSLAELRASATGRARQAWAFVLVERRPDWTWCALAAELVHEILPPAAVLRGGPFAAEEVELPRLVERLALDVPVRHAMHLVGVDPGPEVPGRERRDVLLERGAIPGAAGAPLAEVTLGVRGGAVDGHEVAVVVADSANPRQWSELERVKVVAPPGEVRFTVGMTTSGRLRFTPVSGAAWAVAEGPAEIRRVAAVSRGPAPPRPHWHRERTLCDLLVAVELGGEPSSTRARLDLVRALLTAAGRAGDDMPWGRACVVGYDDHPQPWRSGHDPLRWVDFTDPDAARSSIAHWTGSAIVDPHAAPLERVFALLRGKALDWSPHRPTLVVTVGRRGPHPYIAGADPARSNNRHRWDEDLTAIRATRPVRHVLVTDDAGHARSPASPAAARTLKAWRLLGASGCFTLGGCAPADLLRFGHDAATDTGGPPLLLDLIARPGGVGTEVGTKEERR